MSAPDETQLRIERVFPASPEDLFRWWTDPGELVKWFWGSAGLNVSARVDLQAGGEYRTRTGRPDGSKWVCYGTYEEIVPNGKLVYTVNWEPEMAYESTGETVTVEFHPQADGTRLTFLHEGVHHERAREEHRKGWENTFDVLAGLMESG
jgi:uncharacterized protein YndB with AHSA1/START domain